MTILHKPKRSTATPTKWVVEDIPAGNVPRQSRRA